ncbi:amidase [Brevibacterium sp. 5221]|uniref:Amidase n=1 Tax=Brevibacterium rongguiense TaxID=2695267 RepID=A0A6N9H889_9MICO|nr:amidase family protein [Brevibacterium rongguiense]MYM20277.1 amidase [Brevibacterium rongguiense]
MSELTWLSTRELAGLMAAGELSAVEAVQDHFARIDEVNGTINAIVTTDPEGALAAARRTDEARASGQSLGTLAGVPLTHKDTHDTAGMRTTYGSPLFADHVPAGTSLIVERLRAAGAITTGKSNVPEFAAGSHTFNPVFGTTRNPYNTAKSAGGSSGGVGAALAAGIQASGDGSDMGGSLRTPGSFDNVVGFRPSNGRVPHTPPGDPWAWLAQTGVMGRTTGDVALLLVAVAGPHPLGPASIAEPGSVFDLPEFALGAAYEPSLSGLRVGFAPDLDGAVVAEPEVLAVVRSAAPVLEGLGARLDEACIDLTDAAEVFDVQRSYDFAALHGDKLRAHRGEIKDAVVWNTQRGLDLTVGQLVAKDRARARLMEAVEAFFAGHDVLVCTTAQVLPFDADLEYPEQIAGTRMETYLDWMRAATLISATGCPAVSVPAGFSADGLPVGIQLVARPGADVDLLRAAHAFEAATGFAQRRPPLPGE